MNILKMEDRFLKTWEHTRELGIVRFTLINGVMAWGSTSALVMIVFLYAIAQGNKAALFPDLLLWAILFPIGGIAFGILVFKGNEARFNELKKMKTEQGAAHVREPR